MAFLVRAVNTAPDSENKMHDDAVAASFGFRGGLVPGVTVYGYLAAAVCQHFGPEWLDRGAMDVRFRQPLYHDEEIVVDIHPENDCVRVDAGVYASATAWLHHEEPRAQPERSGLHRRSASHETLAKGTVLGTIAPRMDLLSAKLSAPLAPELHGRVHPAILLGLANQIFVDNYSLGPWIHAASEVRKFGSARDGDPLEVVADVTDLFEKKGHEFVVLNVHVLSNGGTIEQIRHTAIWRPRMVH